MKVVCFDLDDTLCKEIDYLESAYRDIARYATIIAGKDNTVVNEVYSIMLETYKQGGNAFDSLNVYLGLSLPIAEYLDIYRSHQPEIKITAAVARTLSELKSRDCILGLITDGRSAQQRSKIKALELSSWFEPNDIIISDEFGSEKPSLSNYEYFMKHYPGATYMYVGDNPKKDFVGANILGWSTICLLDDGRNIHKQDFDVSLQYRPQMIISDIVEILNIVK